MINLDCMSVDPADYFAWHQAHATSVSAARTLFPDKPKGYVRATRELAAYAANKGAAMNCRLRGDIVTAMQYEKICERAYDKLPAFARW